MPKRFMRAVWGAFALMALALILAPVLASCASRPVPTCQMAGVVIARTHDGTLLYAFSPDDLAKWMDVVRKEARGECQIKDGKEGMPV